MEWCLFFNASFIFKTLDVPQNSFDHIYRKYKHCFAGQVTESQNQTLDLCKSNKRKTPQVVM